jgi:hypothetical protein
MTDTTDGKTEMPEQKPLQLNPEALQNVALADRKGIEEVRTVVERAPWYERLGEGVLHHLAGELAGVAIGTVAGLALSGFIHPRGPVSPSLDKICIVVASPDVGAQTTFRLVPCPPVVEIIQTGSTGDGSG